MYALCCDVPIWITWMDLKLIYLNGAVNLVLIVALTFYLCQNQRQIKTFITLVIHEKGTKPRLHAS